MSLFSSLQIGASALKADQIALQVVGQNIANANTDGYIREQVIFEPAATQQIGDLTLGLGVEVKAGTVSQDDFAHLKWFAANLAKIPFTGIVLYSGKDVLRFGEGFYAVPLSALGA